MDGDVFSKASRLGRNAAAAVADALNGGAWLPYCAERYLDQLLSAAAGLPSLPGVLSEVRELRLFPLLAPISREHRVRRIGEVVATANGNVLDRMLQHVAQECVLRGVYDEREILIRFCKTVLDGGVVYARGGLIQQIDVGRVEEGRALLHPIAEAAADVLLRRPNARRLGLSRRHSLITPESNLLGGRE